MLSMCFAKHHFQMRTSLKILLVWGGRNGTLVEIPARMWGFSVPILPGGRCPLILVCSPPSSKRPSHKPCTNAQGRKPHLRLLRITKIGFPPQIFISLFILIEITHTAAFRADRAPPKSTNPEFMEQQNEAASLPGKPLSETIFSDISSRLEREVQKREWTNRPRTWFILNQIKRLDAMEAFIAEGLNDTSLPYKGRSSLPNTLNIDEAIDFLRWQHSVISEVLYLERGEHIRIANGDVLFESNRRKLGVGSQG